VYTGKETRDNTNYQVQLNYKPWISWIFGLQNNLITDKSNSQLFATKRFTIETLGINPSITYEIQKNISINVFFRYQNKKNKLGNEQLEWKQAGLEMRWNDERKTSVNGNFSYIKNDLTGNNYSLVASQMMEGLLSGKNIVWKAYLQRELSSVFTLNIIYDGRKNESSKTIHTGSVQLRASF
jgi:outer membrane protein assembly factor BamA